MTDDREFWLATTDWLEAGSDRTPPEAINAVLLATRTTRQDRVLPVPWRPFDMTLIGRALLAIAAVAAIALAWITFGPAGQVGGEPSPSPTSSPLSVALGETPSPLLAGAHYLATDPFEIPVSFDAPAGWIGNMGGPYAVFLGPDPAGDTVYFQIFDTVYADPCHQLSGPMSPTVGPTAQALVDALVARPGVRASTPKATTIGGHTAITLTLTGPDDVSACESGQFVLWELPLGAQTELDPGVPTQVWALDVAGKRLVIVRRDLPGSTEQAKQDVQRLLDSIAIEPPG